MSALDAAIIILCSGLAAAFGIAFLSYKKTKPVAPATPDPGTMSFLFQDQDLVHASPEGAALLSTENGETDWLALRATLADRFPDLPDDDGLRLVTRETVTAADPNDSGFVQFEREEELIRIEVADSDPFSVPSVHTIRTLQTKSSILTLAAETSPYPIWIVENDGTVSWHNPSYAMLMDMHGETDLSKPLFDIKSLEHAGGGSARSSIMSRKTGRDTWYDVTLTKKNGRTICHAVNINAVIQAEIAQRNFVQTLAKTFAQLSIGLAIFDRNGQLALFNPALLDLTSLPAEFLSGRPHLLSFFDRLRDNRVMPEPKNYMSWRHEISDVIAAATHSSYQETWTLDTGHTYRVSGRPHPDGAVAFLIEDITAEISLTRNFRAELELGQSMMDSFEDALAVFSSTGVITFCNAAYREMWKVDPDNSFADVTIVDSQRAWQELCEPDPAWGDIRDFVLKIGDRTRWEADVRHKNGRVLRVLVIPIVAGATMVRFMEPETSVMVAQ